MNGLENRKAVLEKLVNFNAPIKSIGNSLSKFPWDCDKELVTLDIKKIENVMQLYIAGELTAIDLEDWANLIECRDDIEFEKEHVETIQKIIYGLANPQINEPITRDRAIRILSECLDAKKHKQ
jgi:trans-2-enoyl-CoA reductase